jgi:hypothetical protein
MSILYFLNKFWPNLFTQVPKKNMGIITTWYKDISGDELDISNTQWMSLEFPPHPVVVTTIMNPYYTITTIAEYLTIILAIFYIPNLILSRYWYGLPIIFTLITQSSNNYSYLRKLLLTIVMLLHLLVVDFKLTLHHL